ncbi:hypothetical protein ABW19_dt0206902 [Dactylella cylindrospora]|nr:hypothetical protein ABW19_dt0206902 [Dactylella cylindrospora]
MGKSLSKLAYNPAEIEQYWHEIWEKQGYFRPTEGGYYNLPLSFDDGGDGDNMPSEYQKTIVDDDGRREHLQQYPLRVTAECTDALVSQGSNISTTTSSESSRNGTSLSSPTSFGSIHDQKDTFVIFTAPPNITGPLHCGHALGISLEDSLARWYRMRGFKTLYIPGCDHAGIATQCVVEKKLFRERKKTRQELGPTKFLKAVNQWKEECKAKNYTGFRRLGGSMYWEHEAFTLDEERSNAVTEAFIRLYQDGNIYRETKIVNWCPTLKTALSDLEVNDLEIDGPALIDVPGYSEKIEFGVLYYLKYAVVDDDNNAIWIRIATTRPEKLLGDMVIAVHPDDERYVRMIGLSARHPYSGRLLPIVGDLDVNPKFGTGAIPVAPGHGQIEYAIGKRNRMVPVVVFNEDGRVNGNGGSFKGQKRFEARRNIIKDLEDRGLLIGREDCKVKITVCPRSGDVVEPLYKSQWWLRMDEMASRAIKVIEGGRINIWPEEAKEDLLGWLGKPQDWCISQQIWWGHRIPAWFASMEADERVGREPDYGNSRRWVVARNKEEAERIAKDMFPKTRFRLIHDTDVLDTWFSSALWPLSTLGWPSNGLDFREFFPASFINTGRDILFFWIARMIMLSLKLTGNVPFQEVFCHPLLRDSEGRKMSKSLGNVIDPMDIIEGITLNGLEEKLRVGCATPNAEEYLRTQRFQQLTFPEGVPECGADALRFALISSTGSKLDIHLDVNAPVTYRNFCEKIYDTIHRIIFKLPSCFTPERLILGEESTRSLADRYILHRFNLACRDANEGLEARQFSRATQAIYQLWCLHICGEYLESVDEILNGDDTKNTLSVLRTLYPVVEGALRLLHPFMPFITEELWQSLPRYPQDDAPSVMVATYPTYIPEFEESDVETEYNLQRLSRPGVIGNPWDDDN